MKPKWEGLADAVGDAAVLATIDIDQNKDILVEYGPYKALPTFTFFLKGKKL